MLFAKPYKLWQQQQQYLSGCHNNLVLILKNINIPACNGTSFVDCGLYGNSCDVVCKAPPSLETKQNTNEAQFK
jgi:hypothetical protein